MTPQPVTIGRVSTAPGSPREQPACGAANGYLVLYPDGSARSCCIANAVLGNVASASLREIWFGGQRTALRDRLAAHDFSMGCQGCGAELRHEGRSGSYVETFDRFLVDGADTRHPGSIYFNLSNACNLQCVQCDGELSSSIRRHREHLPAITSPYGDAFFDELREFIPHLDEAEFAGGEPFIAPETYRVLDLIAELAPDLPCRVITNGTQWNRRVEAALARHRFHVKLSLDGASRATFEAIRVGADFDAVMANAERFLAYTREVGTTFEISHCLMPDNVAEFADLLLLAESLGVPVSVSVVRDPPAHSLVHLPRAELARIHRELVAATPTVLPSLRINATVWQREVDRIGVWAAHDDADLGGHDGHQVMWFQRDGSGPVDDAEARRELRDASVDGAVYGLRIGPHQFVSAVDDLTPLLGRPADELVGGHVRQVMAPLSDRFGAIDSMANIVIVHQDADRVEQVARFPTATIRICTVALRDDTGRADEASMLLARVD